VRFHLEAKEYVKFPAETKEYANERRTMTLSKAKGHNVFCYVTSFFLPCRPLVLLDMTLPTHIQSVPGGKDNTLGGHSIGHSKQKSVYVHVSYSKRFPR
jgi:hypothetical protein